MRKLILILVVLSVTAPSCQYIMGRRIKGNGNIKTQEHPVSSFKNVEVSGAIDLYVSQGDVKPVKIETDENLQQYIEVSQDGDRILIKFKSDRCV